MNLRTRLSLAFTLLALLPTAVLGWAALHTSGRAFDTMVERRLHEAKAATRARLEAQRRALLQTARSLATASPAIHRAARDLYLGQAKLPALVPLAESLKSGTGLSILFLLDARGRVISSGHLPAAFGKLEPALLALARNALPPGPGDEQIDTRFRVQEIEVRREGRIEPLTAVVLGVPVAPVPGAAPTLFVVVGTAVDDRLAASLHDVSGASIRIRSPEGRPLGRSKGTATTAPPTGLLARLSGATSTWARPTPIVVRDVDGSGFDVELAIDTGPLDEARAEILVVIFASGLLGLIVAVLLGGLVASRITRPVTALAREAAAFGRGDDAQPIAITASAEIGALVTTFEHMRLEIRASRDRIAAAERIAAWQEIARRLAHEIKNPLTPISMAIETLRRARAKGHPSFDEIFEESSSAILEEVEALRRIVDAFARFARLPAPQLAPIEVRELVEGTTGLFPEAPAGISISTEIPEGIEPIEVDRDQIQQVLLNLVTNALQALQETGRPGSVRIIVRVLPEAIAIEVVDDGPGIAPENLGQIFTPYFTSKPTGTGLGLAIAHRIATEHGGQLDVKSRPGEGATFTLLLPRRAGAT